MSDDVAARLASVFEQLFGREVAAEIMSGTHESHSAWDSIAHIDLILTVEQEFRITFSPEEAAMTTSFESMSEVVRSKLEGPAMS